MIGETFTVTTGAAAIVVNDQKGHANYPSSILVKNPTGGQTVYLGGSAVTTSGYRLEAGDIISVDLVNDTIYGMVAATTQAVYILRRGT